MQSKLKYSRPIIGLATALILIFNQAGQAYAIYSPTISGALSKIQSHVLQARQINGVGGIRDVIEKVIEIDKNKSPDQPNSVCGLYSENRHLVKDALSDSFGSFFLIFNVLYKSDKDFKLISSCLRDDIIEIEDWRNLVADELMKASLLCDMVNEPLLRIDYQALNRILEALKTVPYLETKEAREKATTDLFGSANADNYYTNCPYNEFYQAYEKLVFSWESFKNTVKLFWDGDFGLWPGSLFEVAKLNAKKRAEEWIKANKFKLSLSGGHGGDPAYLIKDGKVGDIADRLEAQLNIANNFIGPYVSMISDLPKIIRTLKLSEKLKEGDCLFNNSTNASSLAPGEMTLCKDRTFEKESNIDCKQCSCMRCIKYKIGGVDLTTLLTDDLQKQLQYKEARKEAETPVKFNLQFKSINEAAIRDIDNVLNSINITIERASSEQGGDKSLIKIKEAVQCIQKKQCPNKG